MSDLEDTLTLCYGNIGVFSKTFFPETFCTPFAGLHNEIIQVLNSNAQKVAIAAPRGLGKTSFVRALVTSAILYRDYEFIMYVSQSLESHALMQTENIKRELLTNGEIRKIFGDIKVGEDDSGMDETFSKHAWVAFGNTLVLPRGSEQQVRGLIYKHFRPQLIIVDDFEDKSELENPENRRKKKDWFYSDLMKCVDRYSDKWRVIYIDTLKHSESLLQELIDSDDWVSLKLDLCDDEYNSKVPELISTERLRKEVEVARRNGTLDILYMEYRNIPISKENMSFGPNFQYYNEVDIQPSRLENVVIVDPAKTVQIQNADTAIVGIGVDYATNAIYIRDVVSGKMYPEQIYSEMFDMRRRLNAHVIGVEVTGLEEFIKQPIQNEMQKRGPIDTCELVWLKARGGDPGGEKGKIKRIGALVPYYRQGYIFHNKRCCAKLEGQLMAFPRSGLVDVADATAYIIEMLEIGGRYFVTPDMKTESDPDYDPEAEFAELDNEPAMAGWRLA